MHPNNYLVRPINLTIISYSNRFQVKKVMSCKDVGTVYPIPFTVEIQFNRTFGYKLVEHRVDVFLEEH
jgi:hypothetical protein